MKRYITSRDKLVILSLQKNSTVKQKACPKRLQFKTLHLFRTLSLLLCFSNLNGPSMVTQDSKQTPQNKKTPSDNPTQIPENCNDNHNTMSMFSPRFKSVAAMAGWDEETLLSTLIVEDTPERILRDKKRSDLLVKSPPSSSRRKRRRSRPGSISIAVFNLDLDDESTDTSIKGKLISPF